MNLEEAIAHLEETLQDPQHLWDCETCKSEHQQLLEWLKELKKRRDDEPKTLHLPIAPGTIVYEMRKTHCHTVLPEGYRSGTCPYKDDVKRCHEVQCSPYCMSCWTVHEVDILKIQKEGSLGKTLFLSTEEFIQSMLDRGFTFDGENMCWFRPKEEAKT